MPKRLRESRSTSRFVIPVLSCLSSLLGSQQKSYAASVQTQVTSSAAATTTQTSAAIDTATRPTPNSAGHPQVQTDWQERMLQLLANNKEGLSEAWGLFSEGGWSDVGQVIVLRSADGRKRRLITGAPNAQDLVGGSDRELKASEWQKLERQIQAAKRLSEINETMFDGLIFEFVSAKRDESGKAKISQRLYIKQTGNTPHPQHDALINAFQALRQPTP